MTHEDHERRFHGDAARLRAPERIERLEIDRVVKLCAAGLPGASGRDAASGRNGAAGRNAASRRDGAAARVLDVGTGTGVFAEAFAAAGFAVVGIDPNGGLLAEARRLVPNAEFQEGTAEALPFPDASFDIVFLGTVLHEADDAAAALAEARRVSRDRVAVLEFPYVREDHGPPLEHRLEPGAVLEMARRAGLGGIEHLKLAHMELFIARVE